MRCIPLGALALLVLAAACRTTETAPDPTAVRQAIDSANGTFVEAVKAGRAADVAAQYTDDATLLPPNMAMATGRSGIEQAFTQLMQNFDVNDFSLTPSDVRIDGDLAREVGRYRIAGTIGAQAIADSGKYLVVWARQADGRWMRESDAWNSDVPMPEPTAPPTPAGATKSG